MFILPFDKYKKLKSDIQLIYKGYPVHNILSVELASLCFIDDISKFRFLKNFITTRNIKIPNASSFNNTIFSIGDYGRKDYKKILESVMKNIPGLLIEVNEEKFGMTLDIVTIIKSIKHVFISQPELSFQKKMFLASKLCYVMNFINAMEKNRNIRGVSRYISFCSTHVDEAVLCYFFKKNKIETITLQHGLYFIFKPPILDSVLYENFISDKLLCWGDYTKKEFISYGISESRLITTGYPHPTEPLMARDLKENKSILLLLARYTFHKGNLTMLKAVFEFIKNHKEIKVSVKLHPSLNVNEYSKILNNYSFELESSLTVNEVLEKKECLFTICYNSTAYYESYLNNCISLRFIDEKFDGSISVIDDSFSNADELETKYSSYLNEAKNIYFWKGIEDRLKYIIGFGINNYKKIQNGTNF